MKTRNLYSRDLLCILLLLLTLSLYGEGIDLLQRYPTTLTAGDDNPGAARKWEFSRQDLFQVSQFSFTMGKDLQIECGRSDLAVGHCADGAVWAVIIPQADGKLTSSATNHPEAIAHVWLRFHPKEIGHIFAASSVSSGDATNLIPLIKAIARIKMYGSWQAGGDAMIPSPKDMTVDVDAQNGPRRFFVVDTEAQTARYVAGFEKQYLNPPAAVTETLAAEAFDKLWSTYDEEYAMFVLRPEVDWNKLRDEYRPLAIKSKSVYALAEVFAQMLRPLRDLHIWMTVSGANVPIFNRPRTLNANPAACAEIVGKLAHPGDRVQWATTKDKIGYIAIHGWDNPQIVVRCNEALEEMRDTRGLIVDVRLNGGGSEPLAGEFACRFVHTNFVYAFSRFRDGPNHTNLTEKLPRSISPNGPWRYDRPVVLLIGQKCMSSDESFVGMMTGATNVTTMGDHTCGSSGNPRTLNLPLDITVSMPRWIDHLPDGTPLDERGFQPQVPFKPEPDAFSANRDDLLSAAIERLRKAPLPSEPIAGPAFNKPATTIPDLSKEIKEERQDPELPKVVSVEPADGAQGVPSETQIRVRFDRPMDPYLFSLEWASGGLINCEFPEYNKDRYEFTLPIRLAPGVEHHIVVNRAFTLGSRSEYRRTCLEGFQSADHHYSAAMFTWEFQTQKRPVRSGTTSPKVTRIVPASGSEVPYLTFIEVQFDQPMTPPREAMPFIEIDGRVNTPERMLTQPKMISCASYDLVSKSFRIPIALPRKEKVAFRLVGFQSASGAPASPIALEYQVSEKELSAPEQEKHDTAAKDPALISLLASMKEARANVSALEEQVQQIHISGARGLMDRVYSESALFKWQRPNQVYGDVAQIMRCNEFRIGCEGDRWWWHFDGHKNVRLVACPAAELGVRDVSICDPFGLQESDPAAAAAMFNLKYNGTSRDNGADGISVEGRTAMLVKDTTPYISFLRWSINPASKLPQALSIYSDNWITHTRIVYQSINRPIPDEFFVMPKLEGVTAEGPDQLDAEYTTRFVIIRDGTDGSMSLRWGKQGPKARSSSGLN